MKSKIFLAMSFLSLSLVFQPSASAQRRPTPDTGKPKPTGTATGGFENVINSKLLIYTKNGLGTTSTSTGGEFPSQLAAAATVDSEFALQWSRPKAGKAEKGNVYITRPNSAGGVGIQSVTMPAQSLAINIGIVLPGAADTYEIRVVGETGSSSKVTVSYTGKGGKGPAVVITPAANGGPLASNKSTLYVTGGKFTPAVGAPGDPSYKRAKFTLSLKTLEKTTISKIEVEVWSEPFKNPGLITNSNSKNSPIMIFKGKWEVVSGSYPILKEKESSLTFVLRRTSKDEVEAQESGPGFYSPADWGHAFAQTTTASFRWSVTSSAGKVSGSFEQSPKKLWLWP